MRRLHKLMPEVALVQLIAAEGGPADSPALRYETMIQPAGLAEIASYAVAIGPDIRLLSDGTPRRAFCHVWDAIRQITSVLGVTANTSATTA